MSEKEQYLTEQHYLTCDKGAMPKKIVVTSQSSVRFSGAKAATEEDLQLNNNFACVGSTAFAAGVAAGVACCFIPGPGWLMAAIIAAAIALAIAAGLLICKAAAATRIWDHSTVAPVTKISKKSNHALVLSSCMLCPAKGGTITASATIWEAWGKQALTNLGHLANFAFGFLAGRGAGGMLAGAGGSTTGVLSKEVFSNLAKQGFKESAKKFGQIFVQTAKTELVQQFNPFGGWAGRKWYCNALRGFGLYGAYKQQFDIWTDEEKSIPEKLEASAVGLILDVFAAKGMTYLCFPAGTKVHTQWGLANIESIEEGILVLTYNELTGEKEYKTVLKTTRRTTPKMCIVELSNGETLRVTPEHRFYTDGKWVPIEELEIGDLLQTKENVYLIIENKTIITTLVEVFNLEIEGNENYFVTEDGILVHNGYGKKPSYQHGQSDGGPGSWENRTTPKKGADYQQQVTGAPKDTEYVVTSDRMMSGEKKFDGYNPETNTLIDAKDWDGWPPKDQPWAEQKIVNEAKKDISIANDVGANLEYHVPTQEKASEIGGIFNENGVEGIDIVVTPKK